MRTEASWVCRPGVLPLQVALVKAHLLARTAGMGSQGTRHQGLASPCKKAAGAW